VAKCLGSSVFDSNGAGLSCFFFHASVAGGWAYMARNQASASERQRIKDVLGAASWLDGMGFARKSLADMADSAVGVDDVDAIRVVHGKAQMGCVVYRRRVPLCLQLG
jgi:hypothetical protein